jgi:hypothetical protein
MLRALISAEFTSPQVEVHIVPSTDRPTGVGEPGVSPIGPAGGKGGIRGNAQAQAHARAALLALSRRVTLTASSLRSPAGDLRVPMRASAFDSASWRTNEGALPEQTTAQNVVSVSAILAAVPRKVRRAATAATSSRGW